MRFDIETGSADFSLDSFILIMFSSFVWNYLHSDCGNCIRFEYFWKEPAPIAYRTKGAIFTLDDRFHSCLGEITLSISIHISISWLRKFLVLDHLVFDSNQDFLHGVRWIPVFEHWEFSWFNCSVLLIDARKIDLRVEFDGWRSGRIIITTSDAHHVDSVIKVCVWWSNDSSIPVCESFVIT